MIAYVDTSALASLYLKDGEDEGWLADIILKGPDPIVTSELTEVELTSSLARAERDGRISQADVAALLEAFEAQSADNGPIGITPLNQRTLALARAYVLSATLRSLDAIHLAAARLVAESSDDEVLILTRDRRQGQAAAALGFTLHPRSAC